MPYARCRPSATSSLPGTSCRANAVPRPTAHLLHTLVEIPALVQTPGNAGVIAVPSPPGAGKGPAGHGPSHLARKLRWRSAGDSGHAADCGPEEAMSIVSLPADRLAGPEQPTAEEIAAYVVAAAVWAPSVHNTQPWWFSADGPELSLHADAGRQLRVADPRGREMLISCGAALFTARLALRSLGYVPQTCVLPDPGEPFLVARVSWPRRAAADEYEQRLYSQVRRRRTHRGGFDPVAIPLDLVTMLQEGAERDGAMLRIVRNAGNRAVLAAAVQTAERSLQLDGMYARELAGWATPPGSARRDGVPHTAYSARPEFTLPYFPGRDFARGHRWG